MRNYVGASDPLCLRSGGGWPENITKIVGDSPSHPYTFLLLWLNGVK